MIVAKGIRAKPSAVRSQPSKNPLVLSNSNMPTNNGPIASKSPSISFARINSPMVEISMVTADSHKAVAPKAGPPCKR
jgi:hypothetical protein